MFSKRWFWTQNVGFGPKTDVTIEGPAIFLFGDFEEKKTSNPDFGPTIVQSYYYSVEVI